MPRLSEIFPRLLSEEGEGYPAPDDPRLLHGKPNGAKRFVDKHLVGDGKRVTDVDASTLDDKLFKASNIKRSVPDGEDTHGHTPVGKDAEVYEEVMRRIFECGCGGEDSPAPKQSRVKRRQRVDEGGEK